MAVGPVSFAGSAGRLSYPNPFPEPPASVTVNGSPVSWSMGGTNQLVLAADPGANSTIVALPTTASTDGEAAVIAADAFIPDHRWTNTTYLQFRRPDGTWGPAVNLSGIAGAPGSPIGVRPTSDHAGLIDATAAINAAIAQVKSYTASGLSALVDLGTGSNNIASPLSLPNNVVFHSSQYDPVNNYPPGYFDVLVQRQAYMSYFMGMDKAGADWVGSANQWLDFKGVDCLPSGATKQYEKAVMLTCINQYDPSEWSGDTTMVVGRDCVGHQIILNNKVDNSRSYGFHIFNKTDAGCHSYTQCMELEMHNYSGIAERRQATRSTKNIIGCAAVQGVTTNGISFVGTDYDGSGTPGTFENIIWAQYEAIDNWFLRIGKLDPAATFDGTLDHFAISKDGFISIGQTAIDAYGSKIWIKSSASRANAAGNANSSIRLESSGSSAHNFIAYAYTGVDIMSAGYSNVYRDFQITHQHGLDANRLFTVTAKAVGIGAQVPSAGGADSALFISGASTGFVPGTNPTGGIVVICDGSNLLMKRPDGKTTTIQTTGWV